MLKNYITVAFRSFKRNFIYTIINVIGLALGLAGSFVMGNWVWQELSYDKHFEHADRIYRVSVSFYNSGAFAQGPEILKEALLESAPEVEFATRLNKGKSTALQVGTGTFEVTPYFADSNFFQVFSYPFLSGKPTSVLRNPTDVVISEEMALKLFGNTAVMGREIVIGDDKVRYSIAGVIRIPQSPSHLSPELWLPLQLTGRTNWTGAAYYNYVMLKNAFQKKALVNRLESLKKELVFPSFQTKEPYQDWKKSNKFDFHVVRLPDIHLDPDMRFEMAPGGNKDNVYIFLTIAIFLLVIAAINFVNLSTARSTKRAREVGVRTALGTSRSHLIAQFLVESMLMSGLALVMGVGVAEIFLILFQSFTSEQLISGVFHDSYQLMVYILFGLLIGFLTGIYPAFYLSHFKPSQILRSGKTAISGAGKFRNVLVVAQFTISILLIICAYFVYSQLQFLRGADLGFDRKNILVVNNAGLLGEQREGFREKILQHVAAVSASFNKRVPAGPSIWIYTLQSLEMEQAEAFQTFIGDDQYLPTLGFRMVEGRNFSRNIASDTSAVILSESAVKMLNLKAPVAGTALREGMKVIGVVSDFSYQTFYEKPGATAFQYAEDGYRMTIKLEGNQTEDFISYLQKEWQALSLQQPIDYAFLDDNLERLMEKEKTMGKTIAFFTSIAIFISCLGLFGLAAFTAVQRQKEIGIRKVLGATVSSVMLLLNKSFTKLIAISAVIAIPLAWYLMDRWLQNFEYKINLNLPVFFIAGLLALLIAWVTVGYLSYQAAIANPADSLKDE